MFLFGNQYPRQQDIQIQLRNFAVVQWHWYMKYKQILTLQCGLIVPIALYPQID